MVTAHSLFDTQFAEYMATSRDVGIADGVQADGALELCFKLVYVYLDGVGHFRVQLALLV